MEKNINIIYFLLRRNNHLYLSPVKKIQVHFESEGFYLQQVIKVKKKKFLAYCTAKQLKVIPAKHHISQHRTTEKWKQECH